MDLYEFAVQSNLDGLKDLIATWRRGIQEDLIPRIAARVRDQARYRVRTSKMSPDSRPWKKRKSKRYKHGLLTKTRKLLRSIRVQRMGVGKYETGSALDRALFHNFGTRTVPARQFLGVGKQDREAIARDIDGWTARFGSRTRSLARELAG